MRYIDGEGYLDDYAVQPVVDRFAVPAPETGMPSLPQAFYETPYPQPVSLPQAAPPPSYTASPLGVPQTFTETPRPAPVSLPSSYAVPNYNFDASAFQNLDLSPDAINSRITPEVLQAAEAQRQQEELARSNAMYQGYLNKAGGDQTVARQLQAQDIAASNNARGVDPSNTEREVWSVMNGSKDFATDPSSPYKVQGRDLNWGIVAAMLAPAFAAQFGLLGGGAGAASGGSSTGALLGSAGADTLGTAAAVNAGNFAITPAITAANTAALAGSTGAGLGTAGLVGGAATGAATLPELVVMGASAGMTVPQIAAALSVPVAAVLAAANSGASAASTVNGPGKGPVDATVDELVVTPNSGVGPISPLNPLTVVPPVLAAPSIPSNVPGLQPTDTSKLGTGDEIVPVDDPKVIIPPVLAAPSVPSNVAGLTPTDTSKLGVDPSLTTKITDWIKANPTQALSLLGGVAGAAGSAGSGSGGTGRTYTLQNPLFKAKLPTAQGFTQRTPRKMNLDWNKYAFGPEASFFTNVPDLYPRPGFKKGGYAVNGPGTGRSDDIDAKLSDGEYVIDAETVALLGDGSSKAGADQLDKFRVNIRKHKGRALSKGKFSVNAKAPEAYLSGGRT